ncbi:hypothetical protein [Megasphaera sp.]|uniref:hypothetical protein n=1 Tax=Megasphaera sp. TaxID=2023260 RepID=UPI003FD70EEB
MNDEAERIYKELLKQYANAFKRAGEDDSEENRHSFKVVRDLALKLLQMKYSDEQAKRLLNKIAMEALNHSMNYDGIDCIVDDIRALDATYFLWEYCEKQGAGTGCEGCAIFYWCVGLGPNKCPGNLITGAGEDGE